MKKQILFSRVCLFLLFFIVINAAAGAQSNITTTQQLDAAVKRLTADINIKLTAERAGSINVGQFTFNNAIPSLGVYWANQITEELVNLPSRSFSILPGGAAGSDLTISGEITELSDTIRVYTRIYRTNNRSIQAAFHTDFERNEHFAVMLSSEGSRSIPVSIDEWEPDSFENPVPFEIGLGSGTQAMNRTIHDGNDHDFFLLLPDRDGVLIMETSGDIDTYMELYNAAGDLLEEDDDGGSGLNARIEYNVRSGNRYIAKVRGYGRDDTGAYSFRAYFEDR